MNLQSLVVVCLRLMALNFLVHTFVELIPQLFNTIRLLAGSPLTGEHSFRFLPGIIVGALLLASLLFWKLAIPISRRVTRGVSQELSFGSASLADCYSIAFLSIGVYLIASYLPQMLNWLHFLLRVAGSSSGDGWKENFQWYEVWGVFAEFIIGVLLFVKGRVWAIKLAQRQKQAESV